MKAFVLSSGAHFTLRGNVNIQITHTGVLKSPKHKVPLLRREVKSLVYSECVPDYEACLL